MPCTTEIRPPDRMQNRKFFEDAIKHAFNFLPKGVGFGKELRQGGSREKYLTDFMKNDWQSPSEFKFLMVGERLDDREVDLARGLAGLIKQGSQNGIVSSCELKAYPNNKSLKPNGKPFTTVSEAVVKQMIRQDRGIQAIPYVAIILNSKIEVEGRKIATIEDFKRIFIGNLHRHLRVKCSELNEVPLGEHSLFIWRICGEFQSDPLPNFP
jgi:hypothetical protein